MLSQFRRKRLTDQDLVRRAVSRAAGRGLRKGIRRLARYKGGIAELPPLVADAAAWMELKRRAERDGFEALADINALLAVHRGHEPQLTKTPALSPSGGLAVGSDVLFALHAALFPAERMAVIAGRVEGGQLALSGCFDVTEEQRSHAAYTRADAGKLGRALLSMDKAGVRLAAWAHSHPGTGPSASFPSPTDHRQYEAWVANYSPLLALIVTIDGYVRFWGGAAEAMSVSIVGTGAERIGHGLYRINV